MYKNFQNSVYLLVLVTLKLELNTAFPDFRSLNLCVVCLQTHCKDILCAAR